MPGKMLSMFLYWCLTTCLQLFYNTNRQNVRKINSNFSTCTPWFYPVSDQHLTIICDPWETKAFQELITSVPSNQCSDCLPDCRYIQFMQKDHSKTKGLYSTTKHFFLWDRSTIYDARVSSAPFRDCDHTNLGTSVLCDVGRRRGDMNNVDMKNPSIYQEKVLAEYKAQVGSVPPFLKQQGKKRLQSDLRQDIQSHALHCLT